MRLPELAIKHPSFTLVVFLALLMLGISAYLTMPRSEDPIIRVPGAAIYVSLPGAGPVDLEQLVVNPIEEALHELEDVKFISSRAQEGLAIVDVEFHFGLDPSEKYSETIEKVNSIVSQLPTGVNRVQFREKSNSNTVMLQLALVSEDMPYKVMEIHAKRLKKLLEQPSGVKTVQIRALPEQEIQISLNLEQMALMNLSPDQIVQAVQSNNAHIPAGSIQLGNRSFNLKTSGPYKNLDEIRNTVITSYEGRTILLKHLATVKATEEEYRYIARFNGRRCIFITVQQQEAYNIFDVAKGLNQQLSTVEAELPSNLQLSVVFDQSEMVRIRINGFLENLLQGMVFVGIIIFLVLGSRPALIVIIAIPFSVVSGLGMLDLSGFWLEQISIAALVIVLGLLVDNSIAIVENIQRFLQLGYNKTEAALRGTSQLGWALSSATLTTLLAFFPLAMMPEKAGEFIRSLPFTIIFTLGASLLIALSLTPLIATRFLRKTDPEHPQESWVERKSRLFIQGPYRKSLAWVLTHRWLTLLLAFLSLVGTSLLIPNIPAKLFPPAQRPQLLIRFFGPHQAHLSTTDSLLHDIEEIVKSYPIVEEYATNIGAGNPRIFFNVYEHSYTANYGDILVRTSTAKDEVFFPFVEDLRARLDSFPVGEVQVQQFEQGLPALNDVEVRILGDNLDVQRELAYEVEELIKRIPGVQYLNNPLAQSTTDLQLEIHHDNAALLGVSLLEIDKTIRTCISGSEVGDFFDEDGNSHPIVIRPSEGAAITPADFDKIFVRSVHNRMVPLRQVASLRFAPAAVEIRHYDLERFSSITADIADEVELSAFVETLSKKLEAKDWPPGYHHAMSGQLEVQGETFGGMGQSALVAAILIFAVLILQFQSFIQPLIIFSAIPLAGIGSVWALWLTGTPFSMTSVVGLISLIGIVINDSIVLVDFANQERRTGKPLLTALKEAGEIRFMPILLTSLTTIGGLLPLTFLGGAMWSAMGWALIGGLTTSTILILLVVPVLYSLFTLDDA
ncbi:MAG: efflux RND transporter permease subunit [Bacteroidota bacterium]